MNDLHLAPSDEALARLVFESQTTIRRTDPATGDVFERVKRFIRLYAQLSTKPEGVALLYQEFGSGCARHRELAQQLVVGRLPKRADKMQGSDLALEDAQMSRTHFEIRLTDGFYILHDLESRNGTFLNSDPNPIEESLLKAGDVIQAGASLFVFTGAPVAEEPLSD